MVISRSNVKTGLPERGFGQIGCRYLKFVNGFTAKTIEYKMVLLVQDHLLLQLICFLYCFVSRDLTSVSSRTVVPYPSNLYIIVFMISSLGPGCSYVTFGHEPQ